jgi:hypothetical protein
MNTKNIAVMQPYIFPYVGYFCLIQAADIFVFYDDVNFITRGRINRNQIILNGEVYNFTVPLIKSSQNKSINDVEIFELKEFSKKFIKQIEYSYRDSKFFDCGLQYVENVLHSGHNKISDLAITSVLKFYEYIGINKIFLSSSDHFAESKNLKKADRLIYITRSLGSDEYINSIGGMKLYSKNYFKERGINLRFINPNLKNYKQPNCEKFIPGLSIIDLLMNNSPKEIIGLISDYDFI